MNKLDAEYGGYSVGPLSIPMRSSGPPAWDDLVEGGGLGLIIIAGAVIIVALVLARRRTATH